LIFPTDFYRSPQHSILRKSTQCKQPPIYVDRWTEDGRNDETNRRFSRLWERV